MNQYNHTVSEKKINFESLKKRFEKHFHDLYNARIIFSGKYGQGKTTFIEDFFDNNESVVSIFLRPINYSVARNEDIFQYIKLDILLELRNNEIDINKKEEIKNTFLDLARGFTKSFIKIGKANNKEIITQFKDAMLKYAKENFDIVEKVIDELPQLLGPFGVPVKLLVKYAIEAIKDTTLDKKNELEEKLAEIKKKELWNPDSIDRHIISLLQQIKDVNKISVLVIDDLDRLDPEHVFRIMNIFASHFDLKDNKTNKFGFNKVLMICDIINLKKIFHYKYGRNTDFQGYIDKFFSQNVFHMGVNEDVKEYLEEAFSRLLKDMSFFNQTETTESINFLTSLFYNLYSGARISLRNIVRLDKIEIMKNYKESSIFLLAMRFLEFLMGDIEACSSIMKQEKEKTYNTIIEFRSLLAKDIVYFADLKEHNNEVCFKEYNNERIIETGINYNVKNVKINNKPVNSLKDFELKDSINMYKSDSIWEIALDASKIISTEKDLRYYMQEYLITIKEDLAL